MLVNSFTIKSCIFFYTARTELNFAMAIYEPIQFECDCEYCTTQKNIKIAKEVGKFVLGAIATTLIAEAAIVAAPVVLGAAGFSK